MMSDGVTVDTAKDGAQGKTVVGNTDVSTTMAGERVAALRATLVTEIGSTAAAQVVILENSNGDLMWTDGNTLYVVTDKNPAVKFKDFINAEITAFATNNTDYPDTAFFSSGDYLTVHTGGMAVILKYN